MDEEQLEERFNKEQEESHTKFKNKQFVINDDIYSLAFAALINPDTLDYKDMDEKKIGEVPAEGAWPHATRALRPVPERAHGRIHSVHDNIPTDLVLYGRLVKGYQR